MCPGWTLGKVARPGGLELPTFWFVGLGAKILSLVVRYHYGHRRTGVCPFN